MIRPVGTRLYGPLLGYIREMKYPFHGPRSFMIPELTSVRNFRTYFRQRMHVAHKVDCVTCKHFRRETSFRKYIFLHIILPPFGWIFLIFNYRRLRNYEVEYGKCAKFDSYASVALKFNCVGRHFKKEKLNANEKKSERPSDQESEDP